ncbi:hypothetical protein [Sulfuricurvum sp.]|uniref:hypothetical protein n=1 Tax=Sulfuricurvum sp. TaxID=2025608 RepID=UPI003C49E81E
MSSPIFFNNVPTITLYDPLAEVLGAASDGIFHYTYTDVVKLAGHSCPTVAGAYLMVCKGLGLLYGEAFPLRGEIRVTIKGNLGDGVVGVIANVASMITGATEKSGFHGLGGRFDRRNLLFFDSDMTADMALERLDSGEKVMLTYDPGIIPSDARMAAWLKMTLSGEADSQVREWFRSAWQERVKNILIDFREDFRLIQYRFENNGVNK